MWSPMVIQNISRNIFIIQLGAIITQFNILWYSVLFYSDWTDAEHKSGFVFTEDTPYLALMGELWGVCCENLGKNWPLLRYCTVIAHRLCIRETYPLISFLDDEMLRWTLVEIYSQERWKHLFISMDQCKKNVTPLLTHWRYVFLELTHRYSQYQWLLVTNFHKIFHITFTGMVNTYMDK